MVVSFNNKQVEKQYMFSTQQTRRMLVDFVVGVDAPVSCISQQCELLRVQKSMYYYQVMTNSSRMRSLPGSSEAKKNNSSSQAWKR
jgi:tryptophanyl-tRNA synthetase